MFRSIDGVVGEDVKGVVFAGVGLKLEGDDGRHGEMRGVRIFLKVTQGVV
jgi:hypothetical protein